MPAYGRTADRKKFLVCSFLATALRMRGKAKKRSFVVVADSAGLLIYGSRELISQVVGFLGLDHKGIAAGSPFANLPNA
jgi:hypothetical protein